MISIIMIPQREADMNKVYNIGIFAHVDAGKTTLTEQLLIHAGAIRTPGSVDAGTAHTDTLPVERRRGISVRATSVSFGWKQCSINLIDTPGHADFSSEVERALWALDAAVLVVCAVEGVQPQTEILFSAMAEQGLPVIFFLNKVDRDGADPSRVLKQIHDLLTPDAVALWDEEAIINYLTERDDDLLERYLCGESFDRALLESGLARFSQTRQAYPVLKGSALRDVGVTELLDAMVTHFPVQEAHDALSGIVFSAQQDKTLGRGVWVRLYGGSLENRMPVQLPDGIDLITGEEKQKQWKITQILNSREEPVGRLESGGIGIVYGLGNVPIGHIFGDNSRLPRHVSPGKMRMPLITVQAIPDKPEYMQSLRQACQILSGEDPLLQYRYIRSLNELQLQVMGTIQLEVLQEILENRFGLNVSFSSPAVIFRETITHAAEGYVAYLVPKPCWAILKFRIEPAPRGSGVTFASNVPVRELSMRYQNQVAQALPMALSQGRLGWQVTDIKITLLEGNSHQFHTHPLDFIVATPMAIQDGLEKGGSTLLEPILDARFLLPSDCVGRVISDVITMRGEVTDQQTIGDRTVLHALVPVQESLDYAVTLASFSGGRGTMSIRLHGYRECPLELGTTAPRRSVDPLDTSKYILAARNALEGGIFDME